MVSPVSFWMRLRCQVMEEEHEYLLPEMLPTRRKTYMYSTCTVHVQYMYVHVSTKYKETLLQYSTCTSYMYMYSS